MSERDKKNAEFYVSVGWQKLEIEERADARRLVREGLLTLTDGTLRLAPPR